MNNDRTFTNLKTVQMYSKALSNQGETTTNEEKQVHVKFADIDRAHCFPETSSLSLKCPHYDKLLIHQILHNIK